MNIGQKVKVVDDGEIYTTYEQKFREMGFKNKIENDDDGIDFSNMEFEIFSESEDHGEPIYGIRNIEGVELLISIHGIEAI